MIIFFYRCMIDDNVSLPYNTQYQVWCHGITCDKNVCFPKLTNSSPQNGNNIGVTIYTINSS